MERKRKLAELGRAILDLSREEFRDLMCTIAQANPYPDEASYITNKWQKARQAMRDPTKTRPNPNEVEVFQKPPEPKRKPGRDGKASCSRADQSRGSASLPDIHGMSAWKVPFIFRGDVIPKGGKIYIDIEKLSMKLNWVPNQHPGKPKHQTVACNVAIVDEKGQLIFWAFIHRNPSEVCQYFSSIHRIDKNKVCTGVQIETVRELLERCLEGNTVVGAKLEDDLKSLSTKAEFQSGKYFRHDRCIDIQNFYRDEAGQPYKLKDLAKHFFPDVPRPFQSDFHTSIADARMTLKLFLNMCELKENDPALTDTSEMEIIRTKRDKFKLDRNDLCKCSK